jgi:hypothetical protein
VIEADPLTVLPEEPQDHVLEAPRPWFGLRMVVMLTVIVSAFAALLVVVLYVSPLAAR